MLDPVKYCCRLCKESKPYNEFYRDRRKKLGYSLYCKKCQNELNKKSADKLRAVKPIQETGAKQCNKCGENKDITEFNISRGNRDGRMNHCKKCAIRFTKMSVERKKTQQNK